MSSKENRTIGEDRPETEASDIAMNKLLDNTALSASPMLSTSDVIEIRNPSWIKPSMTVTRAAQLCRSRNGTLKARFDPTMGLTIIAVLPKLEGGS